MQAQESYLRLHQNTMHTTSRVLALQTALLQRWMGQDSGQLVSGQWSVVRGQGSGQRAVRAARLS